MKKLIAACCVGLSFTAAAQLQYRDAKYGVSFRYPRSYHLHEGNLEEGDSGMPYLELMSLRFVAFGGVRIATVVAPANSFPGTNFESNFWTISENQYLTEEECSRFDNAWPDQGEHSSKSIDGKQFEEADVFDGAMGHQFKATYYHGFVNGTCFEISDGVATGGLGMVEDMKPYPEKKVNDALDRILKTVKVRPPESGLTGSPSIRSFDIKEIDHARNLYRMSWDVDGAEQGNIWLTLSCECSIKEERDGAGDAEAGPLKKDALNPILRSKGSVAVKLENVPGPNGTLTARLFAAGRPAVSKTVTLVVPPLPIALCDLTSANGSK
jgi:hypothetical protein